MKNGDVYCRQEPSTGNYFAFQIIDTKHDEESFDWFEGSVYTLLLDYFDARLPNHSDVVKMRPFVSKGWFSSDEIERIYSDPKSFPKDAIWVGNIEPLVSIPCNSHGGWFDGLEIIQDAQWMSIPEDERRRFRKGINDTSEIVVTGIRMNRNDRDVDDNLLSAMQNYKEELSSLPAVTSFGASKFYPELIPFLESRHTAFVLAWDNHGQEILDLSGTHLQLVVLSDGSMQKLILPPTCSTLTLKGNIHPNLQVISPCEQGLSLTIEWEKHGSKLLDFGIPNIKSLGLRGADELDLEKLDELYPKLKQLNIWGKPAIVKNMSAIGKLSDLRTLTMNEVFGFSGQEFPQPIAWQNLEQLWLISIPEEAGKLIKKAFKGEHLSLIVKKLRKPEWMAENLDNPLRHWDGSDSVPFSKAKKAALIYRDTLRKALSLAQEFLLDNDSEKLSTRLTEIAKEYVQAFNKLDPKLDFIMTDEREDLYAAFDMVLEAVTKTLADTSYTIDRPYIEKVMEENRDW